MRMPARYRKQVTWISLHIHQINVAIMFVVILAGYLPFIQTISGYNRGTGIPKPLEPACQNKCVVGVPRSSVHKFDSFSLDSTQVLFVHFSAYNLSLNPSDTTDILDPLNLIWVDSIEAPFLSLDLGFNVYSFTTLSRVVHHMKVKVEVEPINCLKNMSHSCVTANLARAFLGNVTKQRGVLCYAVNDSNTVNYRCCKGNVHTQQVECDIPAVRSPEMATIFITIIIAAGIALLCFPALFNVVPDKKISKTLRSNNQVHNPLYHLVICTVQALRHYSTEHYWVNMIRKLLTGLALPTLYYIGCGLQWYTQTYDIPEMFNDAVKKFLIVSTGNSVSWLLFVILSYNGSVILLSLLPRTENLNFQNESYTSRSDILLSLLEQEKGIKLNWKEPFVWTRNFFCWVRSLFRKATNSEKSLCLRFAALLVSIVLMLLSPVVTILIFISYIGHVSPLGKVIRPFVYHASFYYVWVLYRFGDKRCLIFGLVYAAGFVLCFFMIAFAIIFNRSSLLSARLIVYLWIGLVASKDYYFPRIAVFSVFVYYSWNCLSSVKSRYQILLKQTFEKCKEHQEKQPNGRKAVTFDDKGMPTISSELFQQIIDQILPRNEVYTNMILKLSITISFLVLTFSSILVYGKSNLDESTKALALLLTGLLPKLFEMFGEGSSYQQLCEMENACRVEEIVKDFLSPSHDANSEDGTSMSDDEQQPPSNPSGDQPPATEHNLEEPCPDVPEAVHSNVRREESSEGNDRGDKHVLVVQADVNPRVQSINSDDPSTEETPLLLGNRGKRDRHGIA